MYEERVYRNHILSKFREEVSYKESDLLISADKQLDNRVSRNILTKYYNEIEDYIKDNSSFFTALSPVSAKETAPDIIKNMAACARVTGIGPFSAVAGAIAFYVGSELLQFGSELIIENGGDIFLKINEDKRIGVYLGEGFYSSKDPAVEEISLIIKKREDAFGIASSSSSIGHSLNFGKAQLVTVIARNSIIADGFATALSNRIKKETDVSAVLEIAKDNSLIDAIVIAFEGKLYLWGDIELER
ncbi:MAG: UPF0280 family protein [Candidatus Omnitrophota bacterium]|nr:UPF0280 family protein [Candidatus Omnitrophota bacterium]